MEEERKSELPGVKYWIHMSPEIMWLWYGYTKVYCLAHVAMSLFIYTVFIYNFMLLLHQ